MPIKPSSEKLLSLSNAAKTMPAVDGRRPHTSTVWRWCRKGVRGIRLDYCRYGRRIVTSVEAVDRFVTALADADQQQTVRPPLNRIDRPSTSTVRAREIDAAMKDLERAGI